MSRTALRSTAQGGPQINYVIIGDQVWQGKNLNTDRYRNGDVIPYVSDGAQWDSLTTGAWCWYNNDSANDPIYGKLYNWHAVNDPRGLGPFGWRVPTTSDFNALINYLGSSTAGQKLKEANSPYWAAGSNTATNTTGFTARAGGYRTDYTQGVDGFGGLLDYGWFWSSTQTNATNAESYLLFKFSNELQNSSILKIRGFSVRLILI